MQTDEYLLAALAEARLGLTEGGIPIGSVTKVDDQELNLYQRVHVTPYADLRKLDFVQILTRPAGAGG